MDIFNKLDVATRKHITSYLFEKVYDEKGFFWLELNGDENAQQKSRIYVNNHTHDFLGITVSDVDYGDRDEYNGAIVIRNRRNTAIMCYGILDVEDEFPMRNTIECCDLALMFVFDKHKNVIDFVNFVVIRTFANVDVGFMEFGFIKVGSLYAHREVDFVSHNAPTGMNNCGIEFILGKFDCETNKISFCEKYDNKLNKEFISNIFNNRNLGYLLVRNAIRERERVINEYLASCEHYINLFKLSEKN